MANLKISGSSWTSKPMKPGEPSAILLDQQFRHYPGFFSKVGEKDNAPVKVLLSGNMPASGAVQGKAIYYDLMAKRRTSVRLNRPGFFLRSVSCCPRIFLGKVMAPSLKVKKPRLKRWL